MLNDSFVSYPPRIYSLLKQSLKYKHQLSVHIKSHPDAYTSSFVAFDPEFNYILLDELFPEKGNSLVHPGELITVENSINHVTLRFDSVILEQQVIQQKIADCLAIKFPAEVYYPQHRHYHRVNISHNDRLECQLHTGHTMSIQPDIYDLSITGICLSFPDSSQSPIPVSVGQFYDISLRLGHYGEITTGMNIQNRRILSHNNRILYGANFIHITRQAQNLVQKYLTEKQRHSLLQCS